MRCRTAFRSQKWAMRACPVIPVEGRLCGSPVQRAPCKLLGKRVHWDLIDRTWQTCGDPETQTLCHTSVAAGDILGNAWGLWRRSNQKDTVVLMYCHHPCHSCLFGFVFLRLRQINPEELENFLRFTHCLETWEVNRLGPWADRNRCLLQKSWWSQCNSA